MINYIEGFYTERVYAGVLGKIIGVYLGRPVEGWTHQRILAEIGHIYYYVNQKLDIPLVVTDDDISGTFTFMRALEEHSLSSRGPPFAELVGKTWLNNVINKKTVFWWGGNGASTEHTAYLNLRKGIKPPHSGSIRTNGKIIAEQIGGQIFIDGLAMAAADHPAIAAQLAGAAASVSHDGEAVNAARLWAVMEAEAFRTADVQRLLDTGLLYVPPDSTIAALVCDVRAWCAADLDWLKTRQRIEDKYGYDKFPGFCHVVPNHALMIMVVIYAGHNFHEAMHMICTCGWDTDCNSGNVGCLVAIMHGLSAFDGGPDWRGPIADRVLISSADGGYSINNAARIAYDIINMGRSLVDLKPLEPPKKGSQFHFELPGSVQGFRLRDMPDGNVGYNIKVEQAWGLEGPALAIRLWAAVVSRQPITVLTDTFVPPAVNQISTPYDLVSSPLIYAGQVIHAVYRADTDNTAPLKVGIMGMAYKSTGQLMAFGPVADILCPGDSKSVTYRVPPLDNNPIMKVGLTISRDETFRGFNGAIWLDRFGWTGTPNLILRTTDRSKGGPQEFHKRSFVSNADVFDISGDVFVVAQDEGQGMVCYGTREWEDYRAVFQNFVITRGSPAGVAARVRGLNRYYALLFEADERGSRLVLTKTRDDVIINCVTRAFKWHYNLKYTVTLEVDGDEISAQVDNVRISAKDPEYRGGGIAMITTNGAVLVDYIQIGPLRHGGV
ncbi:ADP-ribosylation/Crystallin J1 [Hypoxylon fuscum]|nr:ADP-ribosylation/Crystallin J1 [Hypoxylon fuscum]